MQALIGALISSFGFGSANIVIKKALESVSNHQALFMNFSSGVVFLLIYLLVRQELIWLSAVEFAIVAIFGICEVILYFSLYKAFDKGDVSVAGSIIGLFPILVTVFSITFLGAVVPVGDWIFIIIMILAAVIVTVDIKGLVSNGLDKKDLVQGIGWILVAMVAHAVYFPLLGAFIESGQIFPKLLYIKIFATFWFLLFSLATIRKLPFPKIRKIAPLSLLGFFEMIGWIGFGFALFQNNDQIGLVSAALNAGILITAVLAFFILKERLKFSQYIGIAIISIALILQGFLG